MIISLIVVALVGIGFTRLTMLALELRDDYASPNEAGWDGYGLDVTRKRRMVHAKMARMAKPAKLARKMDGGAQARFEPVGDFISVDGGSSESYLVDTMHGLYGILVGENEEESQKEEEPKKLPKDVDQPIDAAESCSICFEKAPNAVLLRGCNHGGLCYSCAIDILLTSGNCPFCRSDIDQIVIIALPSGLEDVENNETQLVDVIGPTVSVDSSSKSDSKEEPERPPATVPEVVPSSVN
ncbi:hypothetical protein CTAYLR_006340 [Chrysophaeum taylorii]|uniref:RING-type domain-containing protein n=1 Tax=Chrysophaeum taylorii TaxID=2483200 RepID=A0AAD7XIT9_9STRA|nr:hypothetical protein CTAYLR_006340 [Chrysophaeum taylorii]